jgi:hypothetical protein
LQINRIARKQVKVRMTGQRQSGKCTGCMEAKVYIHKGGYYASNQS